ncbi:MAG TPA: sialidase family protein [bacterium]
MKYAALVSTLVLIAAVMGGMVNGIPTVVNAQSTFDITTLAGKVASVNGTAGLQIRFSALIEHEADVSDLAETPDPFTPITPSFVLSSGLDGTSVAAPDVTVNLDTAAAPQNETTIAVDPNNHNRVVAAANDYVTRTWSCVVGGKPCSKLGDGYSGTYYSNDGGAKDKWCCVSSDPLHLGTLIPGVDHLAGGKYDAGGDPAVAFDSLGHVYYAGLGFDRTAPPNTVAVNKGTFDASGKLTWGPPTFINPTTSPAIFNDKEWIAADSHPGSPFRDRVYVSWTRFIFNPHNGAYVQSPIFFAFSTDGGETFSDPVSIVGNVHFDQGSRPVVGSDGTVYVFFEGATRLATFSSTYMVKSTDGGLSWSRPVAIAQLVDIIPPANTVFRVNSLPAAAISPDGDLFVVWSSEIKNAASAYGVDSVCVNSIPSDPSVVYANCHAASFFSKSTDFGVTWSTPALILPGQDASNRTPIGYPVTQPTGGGTLNTPAARRVDTFFPAVAISSPNGRIYMSAYAADVVSPWQLCQPRPKTQSVAQSRINCLALGNYTHNARLDYVVRDLTTEVTNTVSTHPINSRYGFGGGFIGDYTDIAVGSDDVFHALWTDTNKVQTVVWWYGFQFVPTNIHQQDAVVRSGKF